MRQTQHVIETVQRFRMLAFNGDIAYNLKGSQDNSYEAGNPPNFVGSWGTLSRITKCNNS